jgi:hypothetical protein
MKTILLLKQGPISLFIFAFTLLLLFCAPFFILEKAWDQVKMNKDAKPGDCIACHEKSTVLPQGHPDTVKMNLIACTACHKKDQGEGKKPPSLSGKLSLSHTHALGGHNCLACHGNGQAPLEPGHCLACHKGFGAGKNRLNPSLPKVHDTHMGDLSCNLCHKAHAKSVNFCSQCHEWKYIVP